MPLYTVTEEEAQIIRELEEFRSAVGRWKSPSRTDNTTQLRSFINRRLEDVAEIVRLAGCRQTLTISPPPAIGGYVMQNVDPFSYIFEDVWGRSLHSKVFDMLDQTIGVIESGKFKDRKEHLQKARGAMGPISGTKVFLVHGHDESARESTARFLEKMGLEAIILHEQPNAGRTIIEKEHKWGQTPIILIINLRIRLSESSRSGAATYVPKIREIPGSRVDRINRAEKSGFRYCLCDLSRLA